jgi:hypothetical protein
MERIVNMAKVEGEGLESLLGEQVILFCPNYFYAGKLVGVNKTYVLLEDGGIVYKTGPFSDKQWKDFQKIGGSVYVAVDHIEAFARGK